MKGSDQPSATVLLIEDNPLNADMLARRLRRAGYHVEIAETGTKGLEKCEYLNPDLILLDIRLPDIHGIEVARRIRQLEANRKTPLIAVTADAIPDVIDAALEAGCNGVLTKPLEFELLKREISRWISNRN